MAPSSATPPTSSPTGSNAGRPKARPNTPARPAATSPGGMGGEMPGRVGDAPVIGSGTWADLDVGISCTGQGEAFTRSGLARHIAALVHAGAALEDATRRALADVTDIGGEGGLIALDAHGNASMPFLTELMPRGLRRQGEEPVVAIGPATDTGD